jgi:hypothetical protein
MGFVFLVLALVCFLVAMIAEPYWPRVRVGWLGMAFFVAYFLFAQGHVR